MARPTFQPTESQRIMVAVMAAAGRPQEQICHRIINDSTKKPIDRKTLRQCFGHELKEGKAEANAAVMQSLFQKAMGKGPQSVAAAIFWLKTQAGWREPTGDPNPDDPNGWAARARAAMDVMDQRTMPAQRKDPTDG